MEDFKKFLVATVEHGYASQGEANEIKLEDGGRMFIYENDKYKYQDTYYGFDPFTGEEIVWHNGEVFWSMNYYGKLLSDVLSGKELYSFLKKALKQIPANKPFRGPANFTEEDLEYTNKVEGDVDFFRGVETIYYKRQEIYKLFYHGGFVK